MKSLPSNQKLRGGYYTPKPIADFLAKWAIRSSTDNVLEPSCGDGVLLEAAIQTIVDCGAAIDDILKCVHGIEIDSVEAAKAATRLNHQVDIHIGDFFAYCKDHLTEKRLFDVVIGNPPFVRYQNFPEPHRTIAFELMRSAGLHPTKLTNSWVPFLVATTLLLNKSGRMAMVIPAELLQVNYAAELRYFLSEYYSSINLITFRKLVFEGIQQEIVLLLGERNGSDQTGIRVAEMDDMNDLYSYFSLPVYEQKSMDHSTEKWTLYFLEEKEIQLLRRLKSHPDLTLSGKVIDVDVGIVTGLNDFFVVPEQVAREQNLKPYTRPIVGRSNYLQGSIFTEADWSSSIKKGASAFLFCPPDEIFNDLSDDLKNYILSGEEKGFHKGYKCRIRKRWYIVPSVWTPEAFMLRQVHQYPKIILNNAEATCTDTIHRVRMRNNADAKTITAAFLNSLTFAFSEITGRSYGGGVLELEPNEAERLPLPLMNANQLDLSEIDRLVRDDNIRSVLDLTDKILLKNGLGLDNSEITTLRGIWEKLRDRRINRKHRPKIAMKTPKVQNRIETRDSVEQEELFLSLPY